jgi:hypothetical protein
VEKVIDLMFVFVETCDLSALLEFWTYLEQSFLMRIREAEIATTIKSMSSSLKRYYVVRCVTNNRVKSLNEFFAMCGTDLRSDSSWLAWFTIPFIDNVANVPEFQIYFTKEWMDAFRISLHNFLCSVFHSLPLPRLLAFNRERLVRRKLEAQVPIGC